MKQFLIKVNGKEYEVEVEQVGGSEPVVKQIKSKPQATTVKTATKSSGPVVQGKEGSLKINAPMPGTILDIKVSIGDQVKNGDTILILEAMKMENEIVAAKDGVVASINVESGASVESGQLLASIN